MIMVSIEWLNVLRRAELDQLLDYMPSTGRVLDIGSGTGFQAKALSERGFTVEAVDLASSQYRDHAVYPIRVYDGCSLPFPDRYFDVVISSNVLEHVANPVALHTDIHRVLKSDGYSLHVLPSTVWRFWSTVAHYVALARHCVARWTNPPASVAARPWWKRVVDIAQYIISELLPEAHAWKSSACRELWTFSHWAWKQYFVTYGYHVMAIHPLGLFYTGRMIVGPRWSLSGRRVAARWLGSVAVLYKVKTRST